MRAAAFFATCLLALPASAQEGGGRVFFPGPDTIALWELNGLDFTALADGAVLFDLGGAGRALTVEGNAGGDLTGAPGDSRFDAPGWPNRQVRRGVFSLHTARLGAADPAPFAVGPNDDLSVELYLEREGVPPEADWGIVAGTWHSRNLLDDAQDPNANGAWYGYGLIRFATDGPFPTGGWRWVVSPVVNGAPRIGHGNSPELWLTPGFELPVGRHHVVFSVDRARRRATAYLNGVEVSRLDNLGADWSFSGPPGRDPARFLLFAGEDDASRGAYRGAPAGVSLDAVRVERRAATAASVAATYQAIRAGIPDRAPGPRHRFPFDGDLLDAMAPAWVATVEGAPSYVADAPTGRGLRLDGATALGFGEAIPPELTIVVSIRPDASTPAVGLETILANSGAGYPTDGFRFFVNSYDPNGGADGRVIFETGNGTEGASTVSPPNTVRPGQWTQIAVVVNRPRGAAAIYRDGIEVSARGTVRPDFKTAGPITLGRMGASALHYGGDLDELLIFDRLLTAAEIQRLVPRAPPTGLRVELSTSRSQVEPGQCITALAGASNLARGETLRGVEWWVDRAAPRAGMEREELAFDAPGSRRISVRLTSSEARTGTSAASIEVRPQMVLARIDVHRDGRPILGPLRVVRGSTLGFDASASRSTPALGALRCPMAANLPLEPAPIARLAWEIDGRAMEGPRIVAGFERTGRLLVRLTATNAEGASASEERTIEVVDPPPPPDAGVLSPDAAAAAPDASAPPLYPPKAPTDACGCGSVPSARPAWALITSACVWAWLRRPRRRSAETPSRPGSGASAR